MLGRVFFTVDNGTNNTIYALSWDDSTLSNTWTNITSLTNDTYVKIGVQFDKGAQNNKYRVNVNGGAWSSWLPMIDDSSFTTIDTIVLGASSQDAGAVGSIYFDAISIETYANDSFEKYWLPSDLIDGSSTGSGWMNDWEGSTKFDLSDTDSPSDGLQHIKMTPVVDAYTNVYRTFTQMSSGTVYVNVKANRTGGAAGKAIRGDVNIYNGSTLIARVAYATNYIGMLYWDGSSDNWATVDSLANNTDTKIGIQFDQSTQGSKYRVNVNDGAWSAWRTAAGNASFSSVNKITLGVSNQDGGALGYVYYDNVRIQ